MASAADKGGNTRLWRKIRLEVLERDAYRCHWCGAKADQVDHLLARANGGGDSLDNLAAACAACNASRGTGVPRSPVRRSRAW